MKKPQPQLKESTFNFDEFFFSTTDERGVILDGNDVFVRVSGYPKETLIGAPHSIIRHPDMPRAVFKLLWLTIEAGQPIAAYVKNLSADGCFYWVLAFVFPIEGGYLSIRVKPSSNLFEAAKSIYAVALKLEETESMDASLAFISSQILQAGFKSYRDFMVQAAFAELNIIEGKKSSHLEVASSGPAGQIADLSSEASDLLEDCFEKIQGFQKSNQTFVSAMTELSESFKRLKYISLNMTISAAKLHETGASLGVVAKEFSKVSEQIQERLASLLDFVNSVSADVEQSAVCVVGLDIQMKMVDFFIRESIKKKEISQDSFSDLLHHRRHFSSLFHKGTKNLGEQISSLEKNLISVVDNVMEVRKLTTGLEVIRQMGAVESAPDNEMRQTFIHYLDEMKKFIDLLQSATHLTHKEMQQMQDHCLSIKESAETLSGRVDLIFDVASSINPDVSE